MPTKRRFELVEGTSSKFWEVAVDGASHTVRFGRIGTNGQSKAKTFSSAAAATQDAEKLVKEKLEKGYREVTSNTAAPRAPAPTASDSAVRTTLKPPRGRNPVVLVLAGARLVTDDLAHDFDSATEAKRKLDALIRSHLKEGYVLGPVEIVADEPVVEEDREEDAPVEDEAPEAEAPAVRYDEHHRWQVTFEGDRAPNASTCASLVARIAADAPGVVRVICDFASPGSAWASALAGQQLPSVKDFIFDTYFQTQTRQGENTLGDLRATLDACPSLERMFATGALVLTKASHAKLRELHALGDPLQKEFLTALARSKLPALERLVLSLASDAGPGDDDAAIAAVTGLVAPALRLVHIDSLADLPGVLAALIASGRVSRLRELRLSGSLDEDALIEVVERNVDALRALDIVGLPLGDEVSSDGDEKLRGLCASVRDLSELPDLTLPDAYDAWRGS